MSLRIQLSDGRARFLPGQEIAGAASWDLDREPERVRLTLYWYTEGKGTQDVRIVEEMPFDAPSERETRPFRLRAPLAPYSFSGKLISLLWSLRLEADRESEAVEIVLSPTGSEIVLEKPDKVV